MAPRAQAADAKLPPRTPAPLAGTPDILARIAERALWLAVRMVHEANIVRPNHDGLKVGGHQASSASVATILTTLYLHWLDKDDLVSIKPHASPVYHALVYLMGCLDRSYLQSLRAFGGLQSYPSRTKDPDRVDFSTGSVGLGAIAPLYAAMVERYIQDHEGRGRELPGRRFVALVGDAELDEGSVWEAVIEPALAGLGNFTMIVDLNRQSLDRVIPGIRVRALQGMFSAAGWQVIDVKYGGRLARLLAGPGGSALRERIDDMSNEEYQLLIRRPGSETKARLIDDAPPQRRDEIARALSGLDDAGVPEALADLGGHDPAVILEALSKGDRDRSRPTVIFAYTVKGWRLPFAGDSLNHSALLTTDQINSLAVTLGADAASPWAAFPDDSPEGRLCLARGKLLGLARARTTRRHVSVDADALGSDGLRVSPNTSTQQAFGDSLAALARQSGLRPYLVTASPDVTVSTGLGGWVNRVGVYAPAAATVRDDTPRPLKWELSPSGQHVELGISEMNLFMLLSQFGISAELFDRPLLPIGTVYDPFVARGLDALIYALYSGAQFVIAGTPSGITLAPEGGAHQSTITASVGIELPGLHAYEPAFAREVGWTLLEGLRGCGLVDQGFATYLRLSTRLVSQDLAAPVSERLGHDRWRRHVLLGGYRLLESDENPSLPKGAPRVQVVAMGAVVPEAVEAVKLLQDEEVAADLVVVTSPDRLAAELHGHRLDGVRDRRGGALGHLATLLPPYARTSPMVTVLDGASHALAFLGGVYGVPVVPLGMDSFGQSGTIRDLYAVAGIDADHIFEAALLALEIAEPN